MLLINSNVAFTPDRSQLNDTLRSIAIESFKLGFMIQQARLEKGMTQEQLAEKCGTKKGYISKIEKT